MKKYQSYDNRLLLTLLAKSDELAFSEIYNRYWSKLYGIAYNRLNEMQAAEDVVHDVFASLWANREKVLIENLEGYLGSACKYMVLGLMKKKVQEQKFFNASKSTPDFEMATIENAIHYKRILAIVQSEVELLPEKCRMIFNFSRQEGKPVREIANELQISPKTVENQLNKALKHIKMVTKPLMSFIFLMFH